MDSTKLDFFADLGLKYLLLVEHQLPDRDCSGADYLFCDAWNLDRKDPRIIRLFVSNGNEFTQNGFFDYGSNRWIPFAGGDEDKEEKSEEEILRARSPRRARSVIASSEPLRSGVICNLGDDEDDEKDAKSNIVNRSEVLIVHLDTGCKCKPFSIEAFFAGERVFHYDHHAKLGSVAVDEIVFVLNDNSLKTKKLSALKRRLIEGFKLDPDFDPNKVSIRFFEDIGPIDESSIDGSNKLYICKDVGNEFIPYCKEDFEKGRRVFYYQPWSATGLVFRAHQDRLRLLDGFEHYEIMTAFIDAKDNGRDFDGRAEYEMNNLFGITNVIRGMNYRPIFGQKKDHAYYAESMYAAFYSLDAFMSVRMMFGYNLRESQNGRYENRNGISYYVGDFRPSRVNGQTARYFFSKGPYLEPSIDYPIGKKRVDFIVTAHKDVARKERKQLVIFNKDLQSVDLLDTSEVVTRIRRLFPNVELEFYIDNRDFCLHVNSGEVGFNDLVQIVENLIDERRNAFISHMVSGKQELQTQIEEILEMRSSSEQGRAWRDFYHTLPADKQALAMSIFFNAMSDRGVEETSSTIVPE